MSAERGRSRAAAAGIHIDLHRIRGRVRRGNRAAGVHRKGLAPAPSVLALIVTVPSPRSLAPVKVAVIGRIDLKYYVARSRFRTVVMLPGLNGATAERIDGQRDISLCPR